MGDAITNLFIIALFIGWLWIAAAVGKAAAKKNRRRLLWTGLTIFPLGPVVGPLWQATMPVVGEKATTGQAIGRAVLIFLIVISQAARVIQDVSEQTIKDKAMSDFGLESQDITAHYKQMDVDEIVLCLQLNSEANAMIEAATFDEGSDTYLFESRRESDIYNSVIAMSDELECSERTYDYSDLDKAMERIEKNDVSPIRGMLIQRVDSIEATIARWNEGANAMVDETTRFDSMALEGVDNVVTRFTLVEYRANEVSQADLREFFEPLLISGSCNDPALAALRRKGYTLTYQYRGRDGGFIGTIDLVGPCGD